VDLQRPAGVEIVAPLACRHEVASAAHHWKCMVRVVVALGHEGRELVVVPRSRHVGDGDGAKGFLALVRGNVSIAMPRGERGEYREGFVRADHFDPPNLNG
jgi:hypothetical protein